MPPVILMMQSATESDSVFPVNPEDYLRPGLALAIGLLIGMQRERANEYPAGLRTFALISLSGYLVGILAVQYTGWIIVAGMIFLGSAFAVGNLIAARDTEVDHSGGITSEVAALLVYGIGVYLANAENSRSLAVLLTGVIALLLHYKKSMHRFVNGLEKKDVRAIMQFVLITLVILPVLPNEEFGPYEVVNPFKAWLMVVLIVGIGLAGFLVYRLGGSRVGTLLSGLLGGLVSSTATTVSASRFAKGVNERATAAALIIMIASAISVLRVIFELVAVNRQDLAVTAPPLVAFLIVFIILTVILYYRRSDEMVEIDPPENPAELKPAIIFGILYIVIILLVAAAKDHFGQAGLYVVGVISGLTDVDAITLSTAQLMKTDTLDAATGWRVILTAVLANLVFKGGIVAFLGDKQVLKKLGIWYGIAFAVGLAIIFLWPGSDL